MNKILGLSGEIEIIRRDFRVTCGSCTEFLIVKYVVRRDQFIIQIRQEGWRRNDNTKKWHCRSCVKLRAHKT